MAKEMKSRTSRPSSSLLLLFYKFCGLLVCFAMFAAVTNWENLSDEDFASSSSFSSSSLRRRLFHLFDDIAGVDPKYKAPIPYGAPKKDFFNDGIFFGWDAHHHEHLGTTEDVKIDPFNNGVDSDQHCLKFTQTYDPEYRGRYHSEVVLHQATKLEDTKYFGFAFKLASDWEFMEEFRYGPTVPNNRVSIAQFISNFRDIDCGRNKKGAVPTVMMWIQNDNFYIRLRSGSVCEDKPFNSKEFKLGKVVPGQWHTIVFGALWEKEKSGWFKVWYDKNLRVDESGIKTWMDIDDRLFQFRVGIYPNWWTWDGSGHPFIKDGHQRTKEIYIDSIGFGPSFEDADPWSIDGTNGKKDKMTD